MKIASDDNYTSHCTAWACQSFFCRHTPTDSSATQSEVNTPLLWFVFHTFQSSCVHFCSPVCAQLSPLLQSICIGDFLWLIRLTSCLLPYQPSKKMTNRCGASVLLGFYLTCLDSSGGSGSALQKVCG